MKTGIPVEEALGIVLEAAERMPVETLATGEAQGRVLAEPLHSSRTLPPADCSAMDGYALRAADAGRAPSRLRVAFEVPAGGHGARPLIAGEAARIFTGAPLPAGADAVVRQEDTRAEGDQVEIAVGVSAGDHVRPAGEDVSDGDLVLQAGTCLGAAELGMLAALGRSVVRVYQQPRVAILSGGDELVEPDAPVEGGRIVASNAYSLAAQCREAGAQPLLLGIARDTPEDLERHLSAGLASDLLVSSAGVSVGDHDHVRPVLEKLGCRLVFWGVQMKPGYPLAFGRFESRPRPLVFGLPGNPVSAMVSFEQFVRPVIRRLRGHRRCFRPELEVVLAEDLRKKAGRLHFVRMSLVRGSAGVEARPTGNQSSGVLRSMTQAQALLPFPAEATALRRGERVRVQLLDPEFLAGDAPVL